MLSKDPYGANRLALWLADWRDRMAGNRARIAARRGWLKPPQVSGKVMWLVAGQTRESVRLAVELMRAIRDRRLDFRLVLTFEEDYPELLKPLDDMAKTGWGYGPAAHPQYLARAVQRLEPFAVLFAGVTPRPAWAAALREVKHVLLVDVPHVPADLRIERAYPFTAEQGQRFSADHCAPVVDMTCQLADANVDPNFRSALVGGNEGRLWWVHSQSEARIRVLQEQWRHAFPRDYLLLSGPPAGASALHGAQSLSGWNREPLLPGSVVWVDDPRWLPAVAASSTAIWLEQPERAVLWQAMAGGSAVSLSPDSPLPKPGLQQALPCHTPDELIELWQSYAANPIMARQAGDKVRRAYWDERRLAGEVTTELVERVFEW